MSSHRRAYSAILALIASFHALPAMACGWWDPTGACNAVQELGDQTNKAVDKLDKQLTETRDALAKSVDLVAKAVPGERWARLLDGLGSPDPEARKQTKEFLQRLASIADDPAAESKYKLVAAFDFDESKPFHVDFERFAGADRSFAEAFVLQHSANLDATPKRTNLDPITEAQLRSQLLSKADNSFSGHRSSNWSNGYTVRLGPRHCSTAMCQAHFRQHHFCGFDFLTNPICSASAAIFKGQRRRACRPHKKI